jgi:N-glycosylase/DNA lyase
MKQLEPRRLQAAVAAISPDIEARVAPRPLQMGERQLWWELSCCILSSQVPYSSAVAAADAIDAKGVLLGTTADLEQLVSRLVPLLQTPLLIEGRQRSYRFPFARSVLLARARIAITRSAGSLAAFLAASTDGGQSREWLIAHVPGLGPKQASMFLRNIGATYDLAILDRHVTNYMSAVGIESSSRILRNLAQYREREAVLSSHAQELGLRVGLLDWAIWIVMRAARTLDRAH